MFEGKRIPPTQYPAKKQKTGEPEEEVDPAFAEALKRSKTKKADDTGVFIPPEQLEDDQCETISDAMGRNVDDLIEGRAFEISHVSTQNDMHKLHPFHRNPMKISSRHVRAMFEIVKGVSGETEIQTFNDVAGWGQVLQIDYFIEWLISYDGTPVVFQSPMHLFCALMAKDARTIELLASDERDITKTDATHLWNSEIPPEAQDDGFPVGHNPKTNRIERDTSDWEEVDLDPEAAERMNEYNRRKWVGYKAHRMRMDRMYGSEFDEVDSFTRRWRWSWIYVFLLGDSDVCKSRMGDSLIATYPGFRELDIKAFPKESRVNIDPRLTVFDPSNEESTFGGQFIDGVFIGMNELGFALEEERWVLLHDAARVSDLKKEYAVISRTKTGDTDDEEEEEESSSYTMDEDLLEWLEQEGEGYEPPALLKPGERLLPSAPEPSVPVPHAKKKVAPLPKFVTVEPAEQPSAVPKAKVVPRTRRPE